mmetsp:Transcript_55725/g.129979  ORF Transcript_55725/g.129979 Transcript_55725/m.129979 type:complete len:904 (-) Transcript_55725:145-2856(-)
MARHWTSPRRVPLSARAVHSVAWPAAPRLPRPTPKADVVNDYSSDLSDDSTEEAPAELEEGATDCRIVPRILRQAGLRGLVAGPMGQGLIRSRIPGFGKGVMPSTRIEQCVAVALTEADVRVAEGSHFFILTAAQDGFNLTWLAPPSDRQHSEVDDGWLQVALLPFRSVFSKHEGLASGGPNRGRKAAALIDDLPPMQPPDALLEEIKQCGFDGARAFVLILVKTYQTPENVFQLMCPESTHAGPVDLENFCRRHLRYDVEAMLGLKFLFLFAELDQRGKGFITVEDLGCSSASPEKFLPCSCAATGNACISQVWKLGAGEGEFKRFVSAGTATGTVSSYGAAPGLKSKRLKQAGLKRLDRQRQFGTTAGSDEGSRTTRNETHRRNDAIRKERDNRDVQDTHLDLERERFITTVQRTTVLHPLDYNVTRQTFEEMESKQRLVQRLSAEAEAAFAKRRGKGAEESDEVPATMAASKMEKEPHKDKDKKDKSNQDDKEKTKQAGLTGPTPNTPRALLELSRRNRHDRAMLAREPEVESLLSSNKPLPQAKKLARAREQAERQPSPTRTRLQVSSLTVDPLRPRVAAGIGDGQMAVYYLFRSHGSKQKQLHQIQGFDASRGIGDVATAVCLPSRRLLDDGALAVETVLAGFESGRVAIFKTFFPEDLASESGDKAVTLDEVMEERQRIKSLANGEPVLLAEEPLLLEHYHCDSPVVALFWHQIMGIFSISTNGLVVVADSCGVKTFAISEACGRSATATSADMSTQLEQLAVAGQRGVHLWQTLSQAKYGVVGTVQDGADVNPEQNFNFMLVRYMPSGKFLLTLSRDRGDVKLWDARSLELHCSLRPGESSVDSAFWEPRWETLLVFTASGVTEIELHEEAIRKEATELETNPCKPRSFRTTVLDI